MHWPHDDRRTQTSSTSIEVRFFTISIGAIRWPSETFSSHLIGLPTSGYLTSHNERVFKLRMAETENQQQPAKTNKKLKEEAKRQIFRDICTTPDKPCKFILDLRPNHYQGCRTKAAVSQCSYLRGLRLCNSLAWSLRKQRIDKKEECLDRNNDKEQISVEDLDDSETDTIASKPPASTSGKRTAQDTPAKWMPATVPPSPLPTPTPTPTPTPSSTNMAQPSFPGSSFPVGTLVMWETVAVAVKDVDRVIDCATLAI
jgi:hypothetical protein